MQESYHKLTTMERQLLFKVFRQSEFYNFVNFLNYVEEIYEEDYEAAIHDKLEKVPKSYTKVDYQLTKALKRTRRRNLMMCCMKKQMTA